MLLLILGLALWCLAHLFKRLSPGPRAAIGDKGKGLVALLLLVSVVLMVWGYRSAEFTSLYTPLPGIGHLNNLAMLVALFLYGVGSTKGLLYPKMRHPMLWGTVIWAGAHLLVNGDVASVVLFGGIGIWALVQRTLINRAEGWAPPTDGRGIKGDAINLAATVVLFGLIAMIHLWLGHPPFAGTYP